MIHRLCAWRRMLNVAKKILPLVHISLANRTLLRAIGLPFQKDVKSAVSRFRVGRKCWPFFLGPHIFLLCAQRSWYSTHMNPHQARETMAPKDRQSEPQPAPIIQTRIPLELQQIFLASNRGEVVDEPPPRSTAFFSRLWRKRTKKEKKTTNIGFGPEEKQESDRKGLRRLFFGRSKTARFDTDSPPTEMLEEESTERGVKKNHSMRAAPNRFNSFPAPAVLKNPSPSRWGSPPRDQQNSSAPKRPSRRLMKDTSLTMPKRPVRSHSPRRDTLLSIPSRCA